DALRAEGREHAAAHPRAVEEAAGSIGDDDLFTYIYTSGTTGPPKACMIRHRNYHAMVEAGLAIEDWARGDDVMLLYLPLAHNFGRLMHLQNARAGITTAFCPDPYRVREALKAVRPTVLPSVPRVYEKIHATITGRFDELSGPRRRLAGWAPDVGRRASPPRQRAERPRAQPRAAGDGEVRGCSPTTLAGYYKAPEATREVLGPDGWLRTGDVGELDADGFLTLTDRKKDIIVTAGGKNVAPQNLENALKTAKEVSQALVVGDRRPYVVALVTLDPDGTDGLGEEEIRTRVEKAVAR